MRSRANCPLGRLLVLLMLAGCAASERCPLGQVAGTVTCNEEPVEEALIIFHNPSGRSATGRIENGEILDVMTYDQPSDGAAVGTLIVTLHPVIREEELAPVAGILPVSSSPAPFPLRYTDVKTSDLTAEIEEGFNELHFELTD